MSASASYFADGTRSIVGVMIPRLVGWREMEAGELDRHHIGPKRAFFHPGSSLMVISAVEVINDGKSPDGPEYHLSISRAHRTLGTQRCTSTEARWVLVQFGLQSAKEDNHVPGGKVRNFWRPVADPLVGLECPCVETENAIREDKGDYIWRA